MTLLRHFATLFHGLPSWRASLQIGSLLLASATIGSCLGDSSEPPANTGDLNQGVFRYICLSAQDAALACDSGEFPSALAIGGRFQLDFDPSHGGLATRVISGVSSRIAGRNDAWFEVLASGYTSMLAISADKAIDFTSFRGAHVDHIALQPNAAPTGAEGPWLIDIRLAIREAVEVWAVPREAVSHARLGGALDYEWSIDDAETASVTAVAGTRSAIIRATGHGTTSLRVRVGTIETVYTVIIDDTGPDSSTDETSSDVTGSSEQSSSNASSTSTDFSTSSDWSTSDGSTATSASATSSDVSTTAALLTTDQRRFA